MYCEMLLMLNPALMEWELDFPVPQKTPILDCVDDIDNAFIEEMKIIIGHNKT